MFSMLRIIHLVTKPHRSLAIFRTDFLSQRISLDMIHSFTVHLLILLSNPYLSSCKLSNGNTNLNKKTNLWSLRSLQLKGSNGNYLCSHTTLFLLRFKQKFRDTIMQFKNRAIKQFSPLPNQKHHFILFDSTRILQGRKHILSELIQTKNTRNRYCLQENKQWYLSVLASND